MGKVPFSSLLVLTLLAAPAPVADKLAPPDLIDYVRKNFKAPDARETIALSLGEEELKKGTAVAYQGGTMLFAVDSATEPQLIIDDQEPIKMRKLDPGSTWIYLTALTEGTSHAFSYLIAGKKFGGRTDVPAYLPDCYPIPGAPKANSPKSTSTPARSTKA